MSRWFLHVIPVIFASVYYRLFYGLCSRSPSITAHTLHSDKVVASKVFWSQKTAGGLFYVHRLMLDGGFPHTPWNTDFICGYAMCHRYFSPRGCSVDSCFSFFQPLLMAGCKAFYDRSKSLVQVPILETWFLNNLFFNRSFCTLGRKPPVCFLSRVSI